MANDNDGKNNGAGDGTNNNGGNGDGGKGGEQKPIMIPKERFDEVNEKLQELKRAEEKRKADEADAEKKRLEEQGQFKTLAEQEKQKRVEAEAKFTRTAKANALKIAALQAGTVDPDAVVAIANLDSIKVSEDGTVDAASVTAIIDKMKTDKAYLFGKKSVNIGGSGGAPADGGDKPTFKRSQLTDTAFYQKHRDEILAAQREGRIVDDVTPKGQ